MSWDASAGQVTRAFDQWKSTDQEIRAYLAFNERWVRPAYDQVWADAEAEFAAAFDPDRDDPSGHVDLFHHKVHGLWPRDYFWKLRSDNVRDMVTAFEVYMEKSLVEVLARVICTDDETGARFKLKLATQQGHESPSWPVLVKVHQALGTPIASHDVQHVRALRHLLTHQRGELRTEDQRTAFMKEADPSDWMVGDADVGRDVPLASARILVMLDQLADVVRAADRVAWSVAWGGVESPGGLVRLLSAKKPSLLAQPLQ